MTTKTIVDLLWDEVWEGEWGMVAERMDNAMNATHTVIQHVDVIPGIVITVEQLLHPMNAPWPPWMAMIKWMHDWLSTVHWPGMEALSTQHTSLGLHQAMKMKVCSNLRSYQAWKKKHEGPKYWR
ncbi:hypothetical protein PAXRUDRAFT_18666 [Paxillus rubicundulus Ve08.2h10]|uniref:Uncharacterized protein n=1 Tax=Paxillus rubicundulus Ve08.2h10 TaxID=930991 RepID=A0A0D0DEA4_9AGAM|nr:hypothetical protein PAXRUDRAFT_18666 [Paxillus rubicundulus Ve08.2h10]